MEEMVWQHIFKYIILICAKVLFPASYSHLIQGCQNVPATGAIAGYSEVFAGCKLLEKREK